MTRRRRSGRRAKPAEQSGPNRCHNERPDRTRQTTRLRTRARDRHGGSEDTERGSGVDAREAGAAEALTAPGSWRVPLSQGQPFASLDGVGAAPTCVVSAMCPKVPFAGPEMGSDEGARPENSGAFQVAAPSCK